MYNRNNIPMNKLDKGLNLSGNQTTDVPRNLRHEILTIPSTSQFAFGGYGVLDFKEKNVKVLPRLKVLFLLLKTCFVSSCLFSSYRDKKIDLT